MEGVPIAHLKMTITPQSNHPSEQSLLRATTFSEPAIAKSKDSGNSSKYSMGSDESVSKKTEEVSATDIRLAHFKLLKREQERHDTHEATTTPIFTAPVLEHFERTMPNANPFPQYGLLAGVADLVDALPNDLASFSSETPDPCIFFNIATPSSTFICGSQGSGKSHTLSCLLENCLIPTEANKLSNPLEGVIFHYDPFISDDGGSPCEAAYLASNPKVKVRVLCSPTNLRAIQKTYKDMNVDVECLSIRQANLNTKRMFEIMAINPDGPPPLYLLTVTRFLRAMRLMQQNKKGTGFIYKDFKKMVEEHTWASGQRAPLDQRLDALESFMPDEETGVVKGPGPMLKVVDWTPKPGCLTIVDLSCPCITPEGACSMFNICLDIFLEQKTNIGKVIALDEAHKYMNSSPEAEALTNTILSTIRLQRHLGARVIVSTQEPTISPKLLDLSSITIVHRFSSPNWMSTLKAHLAGASSMFGDEGQESQDKKSETVTKRVFAEVVKLRVGEALLFAPSAISGIDVAENELRRLRGGYLKIRIRSRLTTDGGKSLMAD